MDDAPPPYLNVVGAPYSSASVVSSSHASSSSMSSSVLTSASTTASTSASSSTKVPLPSTSSAFSTPLSNIPANETRRQQQLQQPQQKPKSTPHEPAVLSSKSSSSNALLPVANNIENHDHRVNTQILTTKSPIATTAPVPIITRVSLGGRVVLLFFFICHLSIRDTKALWARIEEKTQ